VDKIVELSKMGDAILEKLKYLGSGNRL